MNAETSDAPAKVGSGGFLRRVSARSGVVLSAALLVIAVALAYADSLSGPFVYDDAGAISYNGSIRRLWPLSGSLMPPEDTTVSGRPVLNLSFALDYALGKLDVRAYHLTNILIHAVAALILFGIVRRTLIRSPLRNRLNGAVTATALTVAALWALHPLDTEAVTYTVQRAESLMSLFYLLTLYGFVRSVESDSPRSWQVLAWIACLLGMATKENMVSAPLLVLLYDRAYVAGRTGAAWRERRLFHSSLFSTWVLLAVLVHGTGGDRGGSAGLDVGVGFVGYALTQVQALAHYAMLSFWPHPLIFDYGRIVAHPDAAFVAQAGIVAALVVLALWAAWFRPQAGFPAVLALAVLSPTSLVPGTTQMIVEHRMYLPLAAVAVGVTIPLACLPCRRWLATAAVFAAVALGMTTAARNRVYRTNLQLWSDTVAKRPTSAVAHASLGAALREAGRPDDAIAEHRMAVRIDPNFTPALGNLGIYLAEHGRPAEGLVVIERALRLQPNAETGHLYAGIALDLLDRPADALAQFAAAVRLNPMEPLARYRYGDALARAGRLDDAIRELRAAIDIDPRFSDAYMNLAGVLVRRGEMAAALDAFAHAASLRPGDGEAQLSWGNYLVLHGRQRDAVPFLESALRRRPKDAFARYSHAMALASLGRPADAAAEFEAAIRLRPNYPEAYNNLGNVLASTGRLADAVSSYESSLRLRPGDAHTENNLGLALARLGRVRDALPHFDAAVRISPGFENARSNLARAKAQLAAPAP